jgi:ppGpp synthetase/RelA/SpoT-type nucleotidyltranferase
MDTIVIASDEGSREADINMEFDFGKHGDKALRQYRDKHGLYSGLVETAVSVMKSALSAGGLKVQSVEGRAKAFESFVEKASKPSDEDPDKPKYVDPISQITDLAGIRVIAFQPRVVEEICKLIHREFKVSEFQDKSEALINQGKFGYQSFHFLVTLTDARCQFAEYARFKDVVFEIQVRTVLQHAWAEMEHDIQYKNEAVIPISIRRRFIALAGMLEMADREFESLQEADQKLREEARISVKSGDLGAVEITPDSLKSYLDNRFGPDGRMKDLGYEIAADHLIEMGFSTLAQVEECVSGYDDDKISRTVWGSRQGQLSRFDETLMAAMGEVYLQRHPYMKHEYFAARYPEKLAQMQQNGLETGSYDPLARQ